MRVQRGWWLAISLIITLMLTIAPLPKTLQWFWPEWLVLWVIYWGMYRPDRFGLVMAALVGLLTDVLTGSVLGLHIFSFVLIAFIVLKFQRRLCLFPPIQCAIVVAFLLALSLTFQDIMTVILGLNVQHLAHYWLSLPMSVVLWFLAQQKFQSRTF